MGTFRQDLRFGLRMLRRNPGVTAVAVLSLALGIGANSTIFSVVDEIWLRPLPVKDPEQLARVHLSTDRSPYGEASYPTYLAFRDQSTAFSGLLVVGWRGALVTGGEGFPEIVHTHVVSGNYFTVLGVKGHLGRPFTEDELQSSSTDPVVVISYGLWQRRFGGDPSIIGKAIQLTGTSFTVIGVAPKGFRGTEQGLTADLWLPVQMWNMLSRGELEKREFRWLGGIGRSRPGVAVAQAQAEMETIANRLALAYPETNKDQKATVVTETSRRFGQGGVLGLLFMAIVGLVLLLACANVATLLLARAETRQREMAVRLALGGGRFRLVRQLLTESLLLSLLGVSVGLLLSLWALRALPALITFLPTGMGFDFRLDARVLAFAFALSLVTTFIFGLVPALHASKPELLPLLKGESSHLGRGRPRAAVRSVLVVGQLAISLVLLTAAGLSVRSFLHGLDVNLGFAKKEMLLLGFAPGISGYKQGQARAFYQPLMERVQVLPGVKQVSLARRAPLSLSGGGATQQVHVPGDQSPPGEHVRSIKYTVVGLNYFRTMGTRILRGRDFNERDDELGANVVLISETMARWFWPNEDPMGKIIRVKGPKETDWQIIGVVEDTKINSIRETAEPYLSFPFGQMFSGEMTLLVETVGDPTDLVADIRREIHRFDKNVPVLSIMTLKQLIRFGLYAEQLIATLVGLLGVIGLILATVGLYGVISYLVNSRRHEIGVRVALGAERRDIFKLVLRQGLKLVLIGLGIGLAGAGAAARFLAAMLSGVTATDPVTFTGVPALLVVVALMACYIPACRATKVDPVVALRCE